MPNEPRTPGQMIVDELAKLQRGTTGVADLSGVARTTLYGWAAEPGTTQHREPKADQVQQLIDAIQTQHAVERDVVAALKRIKRQLPPTSRRRPPTDPTP